LHAVRQFRLTGLDPYSGGRPKRGENFTSQAEGSVIVQRVTDDRVFGLGFALEEEANLAWIASSRGPPSPIKKIDNAWRTRIKTVPEAQPSPL